MNNLPSLNRNVSGSSPIDSRSISNTTSTTRAAETAVVSSVSRYRSASEEMEIAFSPELPQELWQRIFSDGFSLVEIANCAAVCNDWRENAIEVLRVFLKRNDPLLDEKLRTELARQVRSSYILQNLLMDVVKMSRERREIGDLAARAITLLNAAKVSFSMQDLSGIQIPGAVLDGAVMDGTNLADANLTGVCFNRAWLRNANFSRSILSNAQFFPSVNILNTHQDNSASKKLRHFYFTERSNISASISPNGEIEAQFLSKSSKIPNYSGWKNVIEIYDKVHRRTIHRLVGHDQPVTCVAFSSNGKILASGSDDGTVKLWDLESGKCQKTFIGHGQNITNIKFAPNDRFLACSSIKMIEQYKRPEFRSDPFQRSQELERCSIHIWDVDKAMPLFVLSNFPCISKLDVEKASRGDFRELVYETNGTWRWKIDAEGENVWLRSSNSPILYCEGLNVEDAVGLSEYSKEIIEWCSLLGSEKLVIGRDAAILQFEKAFYELLKIDCTLESQSTEVEEALKQLALFCDRVEKLTLKVEVLERILHLQEQRSDFDHIDLLPILIELAKTHGVLGNISKQKEVLDQILFIQERCYGSNDVKTVRTLINLGDAFGAEGDIGKREELLNRALTISENHYGRDSVDKVKLLIELASSDFNDIPKQMEFLNRALATLGRCTCDANSFADTFEKLVDAYCNVALETTYESSFADQLELLLDRYQETEHQLVNSLYVLSTLFYNLNIESKQAQVLERALDAMDKIIANDLSEIFRNSSIDDDNPLFVFVERLELVSYMCLKLSRSYKEPELRSKALELVNRAWRQVANLVTMTEPARDQLELRYAYLYYCKFPDIMITLVTCYEELEDYLKAKEILKRKLLIEKIPIDRNAKDTIEENFSDTSHEPAFIGDPSKFQYTLYRLGSVYYSLNKFQKSQYYLEKVLSLKLENYLIDLDKVVIPALLLLARNFIKLGNAVKQAECLERVLAIAVNEFAQNPRRLAGVLCDISDVHLEAGDIRKQVEFLHRSLGIRRQCYQVSHPKIAKNLDSLADAYFALGQFSEAKGYAQQALQILNEQFEEHYLIRKADALVEMCNERLEEDRGKDHFRKREREVFEEATDLQQQARAKDKPLLEEESLSLHLDKKQKKDTEDSEGELLKKTENLEKQLGK